MIEINARISINRIVKPITLSLAAVLYFALLNGRPPLHGDSSEYLLAARSLASGTGYKSIWLAGTPEPLFPFVFPALLSLVIRFFGFNILMFKAVSAVFGIASLAIIDKTLNRFNEKAGLMPTILTAGSFYLFGYSHMIHSEAAYLFFSLAGLYFAGKYINSKLFSSSGAMMLVCALAAYYTRSVGLVLLAAIAVWLAIEGRKTGDYKKAVLIGLIFGVGVAAWEWHNYLVAGRMAGYSQGILNPAAIKTLIVIAKNIYAYLFYAVPKVMTGCDFSRRTLTGLLLSGIVIYGFFRRAKIHWSLLEWYVVFYLAALFMWYGSAVCGDRLIVPLLPFLYYYLFYGIESAANRLWPRKKEFIVFSTALILIFLNIARISYLINNPFSEWQISGRDKSFLNSCEWIRKNTQTGDLILYPSAADFFIYSGRRGVDCNYSHLDSKVLRGFSYAVTGSGRFLPEKIFSLAYHNSDYLIYKIRKD